MNQSDAKSWEKIAFLFKEAKCFEQASYCFGRALKCDGLNIELWKERAVCYEMIGEIKKSIRCLEKIMSFNQGPSTEKSEINKNIKVNFNFLS
jgi:hypothetical protein